MKSPFLSIGMRDAIRGAVVAGITSILTTFVSILQSGAPPGLLQLKQIAFVGLAAGISYMVKNLFTNSKDQMFKPEDKTLAEDTM